MSNVHMLRAAREREAERLNRLDDTVWAVQIVTMWLFGMAIVYYRTIYAGGVAGLGAAIMLGALVSGMVFAVWFRNR